MRRPDLTIVLLLPLAFASGCAGAEGDVPSADRVDSPLSDAPPELLDTTGAEVSEELSLATSEGDALAAGAWR